MLTIFPDGRVYENHGERLWGHGKDCIPWKAVPVPPHGRLIDADALMASFRDEKGSYYGYESAIKGEAVEAAPTVIEAEEVEA